MPFGGKALARSGTETCGMAPAEGFSFVTSKPEIMLLNLDDSQSDETKIPKWDELEKEGG